MTIRRSAILLASLMALASVAGFAARPTAPAGGAPVIVLERAVPKSFGDWKELPEATVQVVNPQTQELLDKIYSQILTRTYVNSAGYRIMLSLAYGDDQRSELQAHKPEVCYPAQGFTLRENTPADIATPFGTIPGRRLDTTLGPRREPVTYWFTMGTKTVRSKTEQRLLEIRLGLTGTVPDGLLFRVSSIDGEPAHAYAEQDAFVSALLGAVNEKDRARLGGV